MREREELHNSHILQYGFFTTLFVGTLILAFLIFRPFIVPIFLSTILAVTFRPYYRRLVRAFRGSETAAALMTVLTVLVLIVTPLSFLVSALLGDAADLYVALANGEFAGMMERFSDAVRAGIASVVPGYQESVMPYLDLERYVSSSLEWILVRIGPLFTGIVQGIFYTVIMFLSLFYLLKRGDVVAQTLVKLSPLKNEHDEMILSKAALAINAVVRGRLAMGIVQGVFAGIGFAFFGLPSPVLLGSLTAVASLVPMVGTALVVVPAVLFSLAFGDMWATLGLAAWGVIAVGFIDDMISPYFIRRGMHVHPLLILMSVIGGIRFFGPVGVLAGPVVLAVLLVLIDIYTTLTRHAVEP